LLTALDFWNRELTRKDRQRLRAMVTAVGEDRALLIEIPDAQISLERLTTAGDVIMPEDFLVELQRRLMTRQRGKLARSVDR
jgi:hypothetical protein